MHRLLLRQLKKHLGPNYTSDSVYQQKEFLSFLEAIEKAYEFNEQEQSLLERIIDINSKELNEANLRLVNQNEEILKLATTDTLTGLSNRLVCHERICQSLELAKRYGRFFSLIFIDLDRFKIINDTLGHHIGDLLLQEVAKRLLACVRQSDTVSRLGGDEFTILLENLTDPGIPSIIAEKILKALAEPFWVDQHELIITASIGIGNYPESGNDLFEIVKNADTAMYGVKSSGKNSYKVYHPTMHDQALEDMELESSLRKVVEKNELVLHYQPQLNMETGKIFGAEALVRWQSPKMGLISPARFITLAEETGLIIPIGEWVIRTACMQNSAWQRMGIRPIKVAVNISALQLEYHDFITTIDSALDNSGINPQHLELEITESMIMQREGVAEKNILELKKRGITFSIDDFGTGYSSLSNLKQLPIDTIKIDRSFVRDIVTDPDDAAIVTAIIAMARSLKINVIAEGTEIFEQIEFLTRRGCHHIQGYWVSKPLPASAFEALLVKDINYRESSSIDKIKIA